MELSLRQPRFPFTGLVSQVEEPVKCPQHCSTATDRASDQQLFFLPFPLKFGDNCRLFRRERTPSTGAPGWLAPSQAHGQESALDESAKVWFHGSVLHGRERTVWDHEARVA
jgi:hypothetical protein